MIDRNHPAVMAIANGTIDCNNSSELYDTLSVDDAITIVEVVRDHLTADDLIDTPEVQNILWESYEDVVVEVECLFGEFYAECLPENPYRKTSNT